LVQEEGPRCGGWESACPSGASMGGDEGGWGGRGGVGEESGQEA